MKKISFFKIYLPIITILVIVLCFLASKLDEKSTLINNATNDAIKFVEEYTSLNGKKNENNLEYPVVNIDENNLYYYASENEIIELLKSDEGVIYFGFPTDFASRNIIEALNDVVSEYGYDKIYYYNIKPIRSDAMISDDGKVIIEKGNDFYYELLNILDDFLDPYVLIDDNLEEVATGEKRIEAPTVIFIKEGKIKGVIDNKDNLSKEELSEIYKKILNK